ncbi:MAG: nucleotidyltransferase domain-containing protein [Thiobacillaceae bacterium]|nr:nucleotidyltransferase domain-containing protein [Thiobacillaceae bacterium]MDW8323586.1 nucleotidyltransferase domain-containing protein [Burkholderiales bacterium]
MTRAELIHRSEEYIRDCLRHHLGDDVPIYVFGSRARGDAAWHADYDLWIDADVPTSTLASIEEEIAESFVPFEVDLVTTAQLEGAFGERVRAEARRW